MNEIIDNCLSKYFSLLLLDDVPHEEIHLIEGDNLPKHHEEFNHSFTEYKWNASKVLSTF